MNAKMLLKRSCICYYIICMTVPLNFNRMAWENQKVEK